MSEKQQLDCVVIGGGIIGALSALQLIRDGRSVTILDKESVAAGASQGNAGILAFPEITPIAAPGVTWKAPAWLIDPLGPLSIRWPYAPKLVPWFWHFWKASFRKNYERGIVTQTALMKLSMLAYEAVSTEEALSPFFINSGTLDLYDSEKSFNAAAPDWARKKTAGFSFKRVGRAEIETLQPGLDSRFRHAIWSEGGMQIADPGDFTRAVVALCQARGATFLRATAKALAPRENGVDILMEDGTTIAAANAVVAAGAWSNHLAASLGEAVPLDTERGYNTTLPLQDFALSRQLYFNDHSFVVTPLSAGIRVGGAVEFGGLDLPANFARSKALLKLATRFLPDLKTEGGVEWMGFRPSMPDYLPVIDRSKKAPAVIYAFGHGHLGLTQAAATGRLVAALAAARTPEIDIANLRFDRFRIF
ncbi:FAD-binding oxidoreductase [Martelella sp. HB161492]|uniref:NAD(P)/FAD-dependent oxidoreductase n=1 Tax=Martelella sp. HB161492 TaxID=2720726 RepID=UPI001591D2DD|nr:FAD-binding oxidoreductase [Martelella sp. HB161492]